MKIKTFQRQPLSIMMQKLFRIQKKLLAKFLLFKDLLRDSGEVLRAFLAIDIYLLFYLRINGIFDI